MEIKTKEDWVALAKQTVPEIPAYMAEFSGNVDPAKVDDELTKLVADENWWQLHNRFEQIWNWLPDDMSIHRGPFNDLCDLCSEFWVFEQ
jgi:hypothetical protein